MRQKRKNGNIIFWSVLVCKKIEEKKKATQRRMNTIEEKHEAKIKTLTHVATLTAREFCTNLRVNPDGRDFQNNSHAAAAVSVNNTIYQV